MLTWFTYTLWNIHHNWESQFLGRLLRSPGSLRRRKGSGALKKKKGVWGSQGEKDKLFFPTSLCGSQYNNVACSRTCFSFLRTFWLILSSSNVCCGSGSSKIYKTLIRLLSAIYKNMWNFPQEFLWYCQPNIFFPLKTNNDSTTWSYLAAEKPTLCCFLLCLSSLTENR